MMLGSEYVCQRISWPELRKHKAFVKWMNKSAKMKCGRAATWHSGGELDDYSDLFTWVERCEGSESDMPEDVWKRLIEIVGEDFVGVVWIDFLE